MNEDKVNISDVPNEMIAKIASYLDPINLITFSFVNKRFFTISNEVRINVMKEMDAKQLYELCVKNSKIACLAVKDEILFIKLAQYTVPSDTIGGLFNQNGIVGLCIKNTALGKTIINNSILANYLGTHGPLAIIDQNKNLALDILKKPELSIYIDGHSLIQASQNNEEIAKLIFSSPDLVNKLQSSHLTDINYSDEVAKIAGDTLKDESLNKLLKKTSKDILTNISSRFSSSSKRKYWI